TASPVRETRMQAWKRSRTSPAEKRGEMIRANQRRCLYPGVLWGSGSGDRIRASSVTQQRRAPGESAAESFEQQQLAALDLPGADRLVQRQRHRARRRVAVPIDGDD